MISPNCSELGAPDFLIRALFHFTWRKGGDGGEVILVSTFLDDVPCLDCSFSTISNFKICLQNNITKLKLINEIKKHYMVTIIM